MFYIWKKVSHIQPFHQFFIGFLIIIHYVNRHVSHSQSSILLNDFYVHICVLRARRNHHPALQMKQPSDHLIRDLLSNDRKYISHQLHLIIFIKSFSWFSSSSLIFFGSWVIKTRDNDDHDDEMDFLLFKVKLTFII